ncbi:MAG: hypothetical protein LBR37_03840 [Erysipelotrichaceae bacterium]|jgi:hypothetical protein|nr:hypothetical protein [Erysipelotrichaceae bacterium]
MGTIVKTKRGNEIVLLDPSEKGKRYSNQLKNRVDANGEILTPEEVAYRKGYLQARTDSAEAYAANKGLPSKSKARRSAFFAGLSPEQKKERQERKLKAKEAKLVEKKKLASLANKKRRV